MVLVPRNLLVEVAVSKIGKYATSESGDTVEMIERPHGGLSLVLADGQRSGKAAKLISTIAARKIVSLLADGVRDGAAARAAHDYLRTIRQGQVSAEVSILSLDLVSGTIVLSRNTHCPAVLAYSGEQGLELQLLDQDSEPIGIQARTKPVISEWQMNAGMYVVLFSDGLLTAGSRQGRTLDVVEYIGDLLGGNPLSAVSLADQLLFRGLELDANRPSDDISVVVLAIAASTVDARVRRMSVQMHV